jgi:hypothetical protein
LRGMSERKIRQKLRVKWKSELGSKNLPIPKFQSLLKGK